MNANNQCKFFDLHTFTRDLGPDPYFNHVRFHEPTRQHQAAFIVDWPHCFVNDQSDKNTTP